MDVTALKLISRIDSHLEKLYSCLLSAAPFKVNFLKQKRRTCCLVMDVSILDFIQKRDSYQKKLMRSHMLLGGNSSGGSKEAK